MNPDRRSREAGYTLVELLVSMVILGIFMSVFMGLAVKVLDSSSNQQARSNNLDSNRNVVQLMDRQVRYANAVNTPGTTVDGTRWVEWRSGSTGRQQTCYQYRVTPAGRMEFRTWEPPLTAGPVTASAWRTAGSGVMPRGVDPIFSITSDVATATQYRQQLTLSFVSRSQRPVTSTPTTVTFTALNTRTSAPPATPVCQEVART